MAEELKLNLEELHHMQGMASNSNSFQTPSLLPVKKKTSEIDEEYTMELKAKVAMLIKENEKLQKKLAFAEEIMEIQRDQKPRTETDLPAPTSRCSYTNSIEQEIDASRIKALAVSEETEMEPSEITETFPRIDKHKNNVTQVLSTEKSVIKGQRGLLDFSPSEETKSPMENTELHIAAWNGKDDIVDLVAERAPDLLFSFNKNNDSPLHIAARAGNISTVKKLLAAYAKFDRAEIVEAWRKYKSSMDMYHPVVYSMISTPDLFVLVEKENDQGNSMLHEAMICGKGNIGAEIFKAFEPYMVESSLGGSLSLAECCSEYALHKTNNANQSVLYLAVEAAEKEVVELILNKCPDTLKTPEGLSPVVAAIMKQDIDMLSMILQKKPDWIHLADKHGRLPLHCAALKGYSEGVDFLHRKCNCCILQEDIYGFFPLHLASQGGHVKIVKQLLGYCPEPTEMLDNFQRNILHTAAKNGKHEVVRYILKTPELDGMINQKDHNRGDTPLHLAARSAHAKTVLYLTWDKRVDLGLVNHNNQTPLDIVNALYQLNNSSMRQQLTWTALKSAGAKPNTSKVLPLESTSSNSKEKWEMNNDKVSDPERFKDRVDTLTVVSTLIVTASVASCLAVPGGGDGTAENLYRVMFQFFIICITLSFFSSVSATIILFWARLGILELLAYSLKIAMPLLGVSLLSLSLAFMAGIYTVISKLQWLAILFLVMAGIFIVVVFLLYVVLFLPSASTNKPFRYISYYPFLFLASLTEPKTNDGVDL